MSILQLAFAIAVIGGVVIMVLSLIEGEVLKSETAVIAVIIPLAKIIDLLIDKMLK